mmetsp:Transcript_11868/g.22996  ORF Transcript_11868/g.22996 Transcript_11868/m.22996 type:complete len:81 (+) Transcript_11868:1397-1639(+)
MSEQIICGFMPACRGSIEVLPNFSDEFGHVAACSEPLNRRRRLHGRPWANESIEWTCRFGPDAACSEPLNKEAAAWEALW